MTSIGNASANAHAAILDWSDLDADTANMLTDVLTSAGARAGVEAWWQRWHDALRPGGHIAVILPPSLQHLAGIGLRLAGFQMREVIIDVLGGLGGNAEGSGNGATGVQQVVIARRPTKAETLAQNVLQYEAGALNVERCRVRPNTAHAGCNVGRWPANLMHDGSEAVVSLFPQSKGSGGSMPKVKVSGYGGGAVGTGKSEYLGGERIPHDAGSGTAARFFTAIPPTGGAERATALINWLIDLLVPTGGTWVRIGQQVPAPEPAPAPLPAQPRPVSDAPRSTAAAIRQPRLEQDFAKSEKSPARLPASLMDNMSHTSTISHQDTRLPATSIDWQRAKAEVVRDAYRIAEAVEADIAETLRATKRLLGFYDRSHRALNDALARVYEFAERHMDRPTDIIAALQRANVPLTKATLKSPYLPYTKLLMPGIDGKLQSRYAAGLAYLAAKGLPAGPDTASEISRRGGIEACARAFANTRGSPAARKPIGDALATIRLTHKAFPLGDAAALCPGGAGVGLLIVERMPSGEVVAYAHVGKDALTAQAARMAGAPTT